MSDAKSSPDIAVPLPWTTRELERILPHRAPFLLVDRIESFEPDRRIVGRRTWPMGDARIATPSGGAAVPAAYLIECMAQVGAILVLKKRENLGKLIFFLRIDRVRFRSPVLGGETLEVVATVENLRSRIGTLHGACYVGERKIADGTMTFALQSAGESA